MLCRQCGTEIADKAIICYRCGAATTDPVRRPVEIRKRSRLAPVVLLVLLVLLVLVGLYMRFVGNTVVPPGFGLPIAIGLGVAIITVLIRLFRVPRRR
jgi:hypothetical protein